MEHTYALLLYLALGRAGTGVIETDTYTTIRYCQAALETALAVRATDSRIKGGECVAYTHEVEVEVESEE